MQGSRPFSCSVGFFQAVFFPFLSFRATKTLNPASWCPSRRSARMPRSEERGGMAAHSEAEANSLLVYKSPAWKGGVLY